MTSPESPTSSRSSAQRRDQPRQLGSLAAHQAARLLMLAVILLGALTGALALGLHPLSELDQTVARWGYRATYGHDGRSSWWVGVASYGQPLVLRAALVLTALLLAWKRCWALAIWLVGVTLAENVLAPLTKHLLNRARPAWLDPIAVEHSLSYPSGHAAAAGTFTAALLILAFAALRPGWLRRLLILVALIVGLVISADRIFLGVHYFTDVIGGNLLGVSIALTGWLALLRLTRAGSDS